MLPAYIEMELMVKTQSSTGEGTLILEGEPQPQEKMAVMTARAVISPRCGELPVRLLNLEAEPVTICKETRIVQVELIELPEVTCINPTELDQGEEVTISDRQRITEDIQVSLWKVVEKCGHLCDGEKQRLHSLLVAYNDIFTQDKINFGRTS